MFFIFPTTSAVVPLPGTRQIYVREDPVENGKTMTHTPGLELMTHMPSFNRPGVRV
jgi:hypothetical protein